MHPSKEIIPAYQYKPKTYPSEVELVLVDVGLAGRRLPRDEDAEGGDGRGRDLGRWRGQVNLGLGPEEHGRKVRLFIEVWSCLSRKQES